MISIHALREEGDLESLDEFNAAAKFLSTPSARRATSLFAGCPFPSTNFYPLLS